MLGHTQVAGSRAGTGTRHTDGLSSSPLQLTTLPHEQSLAFIGVCFSCVSLTVNFEGKNTLLLIFLAFEVVNRALNTCKIEIKTWSCTKHAIFPIAHHLAKSFLTLKVLSSGPGSCWSLGQIVPSFWPSSVFLSYRTIILHVPSHLQFTKCIHAMYPLILPVILLDKYSHIEETCWER